MSLSRDIPENVAIANKLMRISRYLEQPVVPCCPKASWVFAGQAPSPANFNRFGVNAAGTPRDRCGGCVKIFAFSGPAPEGLGICWSGSAKSLNSKSCTRSQP